MFPTRRSLLGLIPLVFSVFAAHSADAQSVFVQDDWSGGPAAAEPQGSWDDR